MKIFAVIILTALLTGIFYAGPVEKKTPSLKGDQKVQIVKQTAPVVPWSRGPGVCYGASVLVEVKVDSKGQVSDCTAPRSSEKERKSGDGKKGE